VKELQCFILTICGRFLTFTYFGSHMIACEEIHQTVDQTKHLVTFLAFWHLMNNIMRHLHHFSTITNAVVFLFYN
jgi:hypothetical protein